MKNSPHDVQTKGGGVKGLLNNVKKMHFSYGTASLKMMKMTIVMIISELIKLKMPQEG